MKYEDRYMLLEFFFAAIKFICEPLWVIFQIAMRDLLTLLHTSTSEIPTLLYTRSLKKVWYPFRMEPHGAGWSPPPYRPLWGVPSSVGNVSLVKLCNLVEALMPIRIYIKNDLHTKETETLDLFCLFS